MRQLYECSDEASDDWYWMYAAVAFDDIPMTVISNDRTRYAIHVGASGYSPVVDSPVVVVVVVVGGGGGGGGWWWCRPHGFILPCVLRWRG